MSLERLHLILNLKEEEQQVTQEKLENRLADLCDFSEVKTFAVEMLKKIEYEEIERLGQQEEISFRFLMCGRNMSIFFSLFPLKQYSYSAGDIIHTTQDKKSGLDINFSRNEIIDFLCGGIILGILKINCLKKLEVILESEISDTCLNILNCEESDYIMLLGLKLLLSLEQEEETIGGEMEYIKYTDIEIGIDDAINDAWKNRAMWYILAKINEQNNIQNEERRKGQNRISDMTENAIESINNKKTELMQEMQNKIQNFYGHTLEVMGLFIAIFSIIGFNLFQSANFSFQEIMVINISCILSIVVIFWQIEKIVKSDKKSHTIIIIFALILLLILFVNLSSFTNGIPGFLEWFKSLI